VFGQSNNFGIELEAEASWQNKNKTQTPNDPFATKFSAKSLIDDGPWAGVTKPNVSDWQTHIGGLSIHFYRRVSMNMWLGVNGKPTMTGH
jgi:hypothetical protein